MLKSVYKVWINAKLTDILYQSYFSLSWKLKVGKTT